MTRRDTIFLMDGVSREPTEATLISGVSEAEIRAADALWVPYSLEALQKAFAHGVSQEDMPEHWHWRWQRKVQFATGASQFLGIERQGEMQGLMAVRTDKTCRLLEQAGLPLVYVDYLATAPWNHAPFLQRMGQTPRYRRIGEAMLRAVFDLSWELKWEGRVGLHALPQAESYYVRWGFRDLGIDEQYEALRYFEITPEQAKKILGEDEHGGNY